MEQALLEPCGDGKDRRLTRDDRLATLRATPADDRVAMSLPGFEALPWSNRFPMPLEPSTDATYLLTAVVSSSHDVIISTDARGVIGSWNPAAEKTLGHRAVEAIGQSIHLVVPPELRQREDEIFHRVRRGERIDRYDTERLHKNGRRIPVAVTVSPIVGADGAIVGAVEIAHDVSERKKLERDVDRLAAIVDSSDDAIVAKDLNGMVVSWNAAAERIFGFSVPEMVGQSIRLLIPDDRQQEEDEVLTRIRRGERVEHYETVRRRKDGGTIPVSLTVSPIRNAAGTIVGASKIARDISDRKRAEQERQRLLGIATGRGAGWGMISSPRSRMNCGRR